VIPSRRAPALDPSCPSGCGLGDLLLDLAHHRRGVMLALGRALGETMAVTFVIGNAHKISPSLFAPGTTISATIANEFTEAVGDIYTSSLIELGLILFFITFVVLSIARYLLMRIEQKSA
jgi:phosphate transport system permease protein